MLDKIWHKGLLYELEQNSISYKLLDTFTGFVDFRKQRFYLDGQLSSWTSIKAGVTQGSILGPLSFLSYSDDHLPDDLITNLKLFVNYSSLFSEVNEMNLSTNNLSKDLGKITDYVIQRKKLLTLNARKKVNFFQKMSESKSWINIQEHLNYIMSESNFTASFLS